MADDATWAALAAARAVLARWPGLVPARAELDDIAAGLAGPMRVALVGRVSAGKSTLANALLGGYRAPTGAQELTYHVTWIRHGKRPALTVHFRDGRPSLQEDIATLGRHVSRTDDPELARLLPAIDHLEVTDPAPYLQSFDLVDTPGLDSVFGSDSENTLRFLGGPVDAMVLVVSRGLQAREPDLLADFQSRTLTPSPINALAALTKIEHYWNWRDRRDPMEVGHEIAAQMMAVSSVRRVVHDVRPVASLIGAAAAVMTERDVADLRALADLSAGELARWVRRESSFEALGPTEVAVPPWRRAALWRMFSPYGIVLACDLLRERHRDLAALREGLDDRTGMATFRQLLVEHFGARASLVKLNRAFGRVQALPTLMGEGRSPGERAALGAAVKEFSRYGLSQSPRFRELQTLRAFYDGWLDLTEEEGAELLRVTGELGQSAAARLGHPPGTGAEELSARARLRLAYWRERQIWDGFAGPTREAVRVLVKAYERIIDRMGDMRWEETS